MINFPWLSGKIETISKMLAVATAFAIPLSTSLTGVLFVLTVGLFYLAGNWQDKIMFIFYNRIALYLLLFFSFFVVGMTYTTASLSDALAMLGKYDKLLFAVLLLPIFREERWRNYALNAFITAVGILLFFSYLKYFGVIKYGANYGPVEIFKGHIAFNFLMSFVAYLLLTKVAVARGWQRWALAGLLGLIVYNIFFMSIARSGYFVFIALVILFFFQRLRRREVFVALLGTAVLFTCVFIFSPVVKSRMADMISDIKEYNYNKVTSVGLRMSFVKNSFHLIQEHPLFGTGTGSFKSEYAKIQPSPIVKTHNPHNEYLHIGVQFGTVGIMLLLLNFIMQLRYSKYLPKPYRNIAQAVVLSIMIGSLANSWLLDTTQGHFYAFFIAVTFAGLSVYGKKEISSSRGNNSEITAA